MIRWSSFGKALCVHWRLTMDDLILVRSSSFRVFPGGCCVPRPRSLIFNILTGSSRVTTIWSTRDFIVIESRVSGSWPLMWPACSGKVTITCEFWITRISTLIWTTSFCIVSGIRWRRITGESTSIVSSRLFRIAIIFTFAFICIFCDEAEQFRQTPGRRILQKKCKIGLIEKIVKYFRFGVWNLLFRSYARKIFDWCTFCPCDAVDRTSENRMISLSEIHPSKLCKCISVPYARICNEPKLRFLHEGFFHKCYNAKNEPFSTNLIFLSPRKSIVSIYDVQAIDENDHSLLAV